MSAFVRNSEMEALGALRVNDPTAYARVSPVLKISLHHYQAAKAAAETDQEQN